MSEIHNEGSREITDVSLQIEFQSLEGEVLGVMSVAVDEVDAHSSLAGDNLEMLIIGHTVWDEYIISIDLQYTDYNNNIQNEEWSHSIGVWSSEYFTDKADRSTWPIS